VSLKRLVPLLLLGAASLGSAPSAAQRPLRGSEAVPPGHPNVAGSAAPRAGAAAPNAHAGAAPANPRASAGPANPHADPATADTDEPEAQPEEAARAEAEGEPPPDRSSALPTLPPGTLELALVDENEKPLANVPVRLGILRQTIAEGETRSEKHAVTDARGQVRFAELQVGSDYSYRATIARGVATYASPPVTLGREMGHGLLMHVYPVVRNVKEALIGLRGFVHVEPRDDVFQVEAMFHVFNIGRVTWVPENLQLDLPDGFKAFTAQESMSDTKFAGTERGARLEGTFSPGQHQLSFRFQIPNDHEETVSLGLGMPPHVAEMRVSTQAAAGMTLAVEGFPPAQATSLQTGERALVTGRQLGRGEAQMRELVLTLGGIPTPGPARWIAVALALGAAAFGLSSAFQKRSGKNEPSRTSDGVLAREVLLAELATLERAKKAQQIGPRTYEAARRALLDAMTRIEKTLASTGRNLRSPAASSAE
jgi:hypothetical protein